MRKMSEEGKLTPEAIEAIMLEEKPNQKERIVLRGDRFKELFPKDLPVSKREDFVAAAMEYYGRYLSRKNAITRDRNAKINGRTRSTLDRSSPHPYFM